MSPGGAGEVHILRFQDQGYEAGEIARICKWLTTRKKVKPDAVLILLRSDRNKVLSKPLRAALLSEGIPVGVISNPLEALETNEGRNFISILRLLLNPQDHLAWRSLLEVRSNRLGGTTTSAIYELARTNNWNYARTLSEIRRDPTRIPRMGAALAKECEEIENSLNRLEKPPRAGIITWVETVAKTLISDDEGRELVLEVFRNTAKASVADNLDSLLKAINVSLGNFEQERPERVVPIMTMHQAKGLTADAVFVVAAEDEYVPGRYTSGDLFDDERRLLYVSLTRAKHFLYITYATQRTGAQRHTGRTAGISKRQLTRFLSGGPVTVQHGDAFVSKLR
jgi:DNA helicase-2/ATP-dependent DNA helicase PcrA